MGRDSPMALAALLVVTVACAQQPTTTTDGWPTLTIDVSWSSAPVRPEPAVDLSQRRTLEIPELAEAPEIDGALDDVAWQDAAETGPWMTNTGEAEAVVQTTAWLGVHGGQLYVAARAEEPNVDGIVANVTEDGGPAWGDDCIELFVDGNLDLSTVRQVIVNSIGTVTTAAFGVGEWNPAVRRAAHVGENAWFVEFALPLRSLGLAGTDFGLNICRERRAGDGVELSCWSPTGGSFNQPARFGLASLPGGWLQPFSVGEAVLGQNELTVTLENTTDEPRSLRARLRWWQGNETDAQASVRGPYTLQPGATREISFTYDVHRAGEPIELEVAVLDAAGGELAARRVTQPLVDVLALDVSRHVLRDTASRMALRGVVRAAQNVRDEAVAVLAIFDEQMWLRVREEIAPVEGEVMRAELRLPDLPPGEYSLHLVLKESAADDAARIAEEKVAVIVLPRPWSATEKVQKTYHSD